MTLNHLSLVQFKNLKSADLGFDSDVNCLVGLNGAGKTNVLDAIHYLCTCKSYFNPIDVQNINHDSEFFMISGDFEKNDKKDVINCAVKRGQKKIFKKNKSTYKRLAEHIGEYPVVIISPDDKELISGGSELRRRFIDSIIANTDKAYLYDLIRYNKVLSHRNHQLRSFLKKANFDNSLLEPWDQQLFPLNASIYEKRKAFLNDFIPGFNHYYGLVSGNSEAISMEYNSHLNEDEPIMQQFQRYLMKDRQRGFSTRGIHRDDTLFKIEGYPLRKFGSQGQQKSYLIALKLAQFDWLKKGTGQTPLLLLDDIFEKIDDIRVKNLMHLVRQHHFGQIFITDTDAGRIPAIFKDMDTSMHLFSVEHGEINPQV